MVDTESVYQMEGPGEGKIPGSKCVKGTVFVSYTTYSRMSP